MNTTAIHFPADLSLADLAQAVAHIGCRLQIGERAEIHVVPAPVEFEPVSEELPLVEVDDLEYELPQWLRRSAE